MRHHIASVVVVVLTLASLVQLSLCYKPRVQSHHLIEDADLELTGDGVFMEQGETTRATQVPPSTAPQRLKMNTSSSTWQQAQQFCQSRGRRLCRHAEYCPEGVGKPPLGGVPKSSVWAAVDDEPNEWVAIGSTFPLTLLCKTHTQIARRKPKWGETNAATPRRALVACCDDTFVLVPRNLTNKDAAAECARRNAGSRLCWAKEYCPDGVGKPPRGGIPAAPLLQPSAGWAPVGDDNSGGNEWVYVGAPQGSAQPPLVTCQTYTATFSSAPAWGNTTGRPGLLQCCTGAPPVVAPANNTNATAPAPPPAPQNVTVAPTPAPTPLVIPEDERRIGINATDPEEDDRERHRVLSEVREKQLRLAELRRQRKVNEKAHKQRLREMRMKSPQAFPSDVNVSKNRKRRGGRRGDGKKKKRKHHHRPGVFSPYRRLRLLKEQACKRQSSQCNQGWRSFF